MYEVRKSDIACGLKDSEARTSNIVHRVDSYIVHRVGSYL
jgi:hypothetical protein